MYLIPGQIGIWNFVFWREGKTGAPGEKPLTAKERTHNKINPHMAWRPGFEPWRHWSEASALTSAPPLLPTSSIRKSKTETFPCSDFFFIFNCLQINVVDGLFFKPFSRFLEKNLRKQRALERHVSWQTSVLELNVYNLHKLLSEAKSCVVVYVVLLTATRGTAASVILQENDLLEKWAQICLNTALR